VQWLNASIATAAHDRVVLIRRELEELGNWPSRKGEQDWFHRVNRLNKALAKYTFHPHATYLLLSRTKEFGMRSADHTELVKLQIGGKFFGYVSEALAVLALVRLANMGDLKKVRQCAMCRNRWCLAAKRNYRFCSAQCRESFYIKSPKYSSRKAASQRAYRARLKQRKANYNTGRN
jgi:hypothetical protein